MVDSSAWVAWFKEDDPRHDRAKNLLLREDANLPPLLMSNLAAYETLTVLSIRVNKAKSLAFGDWLYRQAIANGWVKYLFTDELVESKAWQLFQSTQKKDVSFVDCVLAVTAQEEKAAGIITFDKHFQTLGAKLGLNIIS